jgi:hypothetical protein
MLSHFSFVRFLGGLALLACSGVVMMMAAPLPQLRDTILRWAMFLAAYHGRGGFLIACGLLTTTMGLAGLLAGIWAMLLGAVHILLYIFFRDIVEEDYSTLISRQQGKAVDQIEVAMEPEPKNFYSSSTSSATYGSIGAY